MDTGGQSAKEQSEGWLRQRGLFGYNTRVVTVDGPEKKLGYVKQLGISALVDDYLPTVASMKNVTDAYLMNRPWNQSDSPLGLNVVADMSEFFKTISLFDTLLK
jgi:hypothetical protein